MPETYSRATLPRILWGVAGLAGGFLLAILMFFAWRGITSGTIIRTSDPAAIVLQIQKLNELVSVKYTIQKVIGLEEQKVPMGSEKLLLIVQAQVLAGIDLSKITAENVTILPDKSVRVRLPAPKIVQVAIDDKETKVWDRRITWWTPWVPFNPDLERQARLAARESVEKAALEMGILDQAYRNAEAGIRGLLETMGVKLAPVEKS